MSGPTALRVAIVTSGRFHVLDLARELTVLGHEVTFYSLLPPWHLSARGVDGSRGVWVGAVGAPLHYAQRLTRWPRFSSRTAELSCVAIDRTAALRLRPCDVLVGMAGMSLRTIERAHREHRAVTFLERSSQHIEAQFRTLGLPTDTAKVRRELTEYETTDFIAVPSHHVEASFVSRGFRPGKLVCNPLGVDLEEFPWSSGPQGAGPLQVLLAGSWTYQKGADVLGTAAARLDAVRFAHVGARPEAAIQPGPRVVSHAPVPQRELSAFYARADVLVLPSRQDGFGMVLSQALASGCHVVASDRTGGPDLAELLGPSAPVTIVPAGDADALTSALRDLHATRDTLRARRRERAPWRDRLAWRDYALRYERAMLRGVAERRASTSTGPEPTRGPTA